MEFRQVWQYEWSLRSSCWECSWTTSKDGLVAELVMLFTLLFVS
jgi:hypothetical protein